MDHSLVDRLLDRTIEIQQIPAPTFAEHERAEFVRQQFAAEGLEDVSMDSLGNVYARLPGAGETRPLVVSAHTDTVFPIETDLTVQRSSGRIVGPGIGDNSLGVAGLFALLWALGQQESPLPGDLWLVANVGEEGLGDLKGMRAVAEHFGELPLAYIILEGMMYGHIYHRGLGVRRYWIKASTRGGHSWGDYGSPSAIHELAALVNRLTAIKLPEKPRTTMNIGVIRGGTSVNTIAGEAWLELDLRSVDMKQLAALAAQVEKLVGKANRKGVTFSFEIIGDRPVGSIPPDHPLVQLASNVLKAQGVNADLNIGSTDANIILSKGIPAICIGLALGNSAHTPQEYFLTEKVGDGLAQLLAVVQGAYAALEN